MRRLQIIGFFASFLCFGCTSPEPYQVNAESDDRDSGLRSLLHDVSAQLNLFVNQEIDAARSEINLQQLTGNDELRDQLVLNVGERLSRRRPGTGIGIHFGEFSLEISTLSEIEAYLVDSLAEEKSEIFRTKFLDSRYGDNPIGPVRGQFFSHKSEKAADHSIAPSIRIGQTIFGIDKLGHFAEEGFWYYLAERDGLLSGENERLEFGQFMEGCPELNKSLHAKYKKIFGVYCKACVLLGGFGYYGVASTGVCSRGDLESNEDGYNFFKALFADPLNYTFDIGDFQSDRWNETINKNYYAPGLIVRP